MTDSAHHIKAWLAGEIAKDEDPPLWYWKLLAAIESLQYEVQTKGFQAAIDHYFGIEAEED